MRSITIAARASRRSQSSTFTFIPAGRPWSVWWPQGVGFNRNRRIKPMHLKTRNSLFRAPIFRDGADSDSVNLGSNPGSSARESASNRCVFVVSSLAGIVLKLPRVSYPAKASAATRDAKCLGAGREGRRVPRLRFESSMWSVSAGF